MRSTVSKPAHDPPAAVATLDSAAPARSLALYREAVMAHENKVVRSINLPGDTFCVDIFVRPDGSYGFEEYRRDPEDGRGWFGIGHHGERRFDSYEAACLTARKVVGWLGTALD